MKDRVIKYFKEGGSFSAGAVLYASIPGHSLSYARQLNHMTDTPANRANLHYEIGRLIGLRQTQVMALLSGKSGKHKPKVVVLDYADMSYYDLKAKVEELGIEVPNKKKETLQAALATHGKKLPDNPESSDTPEEPVKAESGDISSTDPGESAQKQEETTEETEESEPDEPGK